MDFGDRKQDIPCFVNSKALYINCITIANIYWVLFYQVLCQVFYVYLPFCAVLSRSVMSDFLPPHGLPPKVAPVQEILQGKILEGVAMPSSRGSSQPRWILYRLSPQGSLFTFLGLVLVLLLISTLQLRCGEGKNLSGVTKVKTRIRIWIQSVRFWDLTLLNIFF